jgi:hypothetical protein
MANPIELTTDERKLHKELMTVFKSLWNDEMRYDFNHLENLAQNLHSSLESRGITPHHHKYMVQNRGVQPNQSGFYHHLHSVEDLLKFIEDPESNNDPEDITMGHEFEFIFFCRRWSRNDNYKLKRTPQGWNIKHLSINGDCSSDGNPFIIKNFDQDYVSYPHDIGSFFSSIWSNASKGTDHNDVQNQLNKVADLISVIEKSKPNEILV